MSAIPGPYYVIPASVIDNHGWLIEASQPDNDEGIIVAECDRKADAVLFAAVHDLLAACGSLLSLVDTDPVCYLGGDEPMRAVVDHVRAALAKARGKA